MKTLVSLFFVCFISSIFAEERRHGKVKSLEEHTIQAWNKDSEKWTSIDDFWTHFSHSNKGKYWGASSEYPNYDDVNEYDTFLVTLEQGSCLMQFFHSRWRRANDVQRWDDVFNQYSGCPFVFE